VKNGVSLFLNFDIILFIKLCFVCSCLSRAGARLCLGYTARTKGFTASESLSKNSSFILSVSFFVFLLNIFMIITFLFSFISGKISIIGNPHFQIYSVGVIHESPAGILQNCSFFAVDSCKSIGDS